MSNLEELRKQAVRDIQDMEDRRTMKALCSTPLADEIERLRTPRDEWAAKGLTIEDDHG